MHANGKHLSNRQIEDIIHECGLIESIERKWDTDCMGVSPYHRVILKKRVSLLRDGAIEDVWKLFKKYNLGASIQLHPARLMDYYLPYSKSGMIGSTPLTAEDIRNLKNTPLYCLLIVMIITYILLD